MASYAPPPLAAAHHPRRASLHRALAGLRAGLLYAHPEEVEDAFVRAPAAECGRKAEVWFGKACEYDEKGAYRVEGRVGARRMTVGSCVAMLLLLLLAMWVILVQAA